MSATTPLSYNNTTGAFSIQVANTSQDGYLSSTDWNTFNGKQNTITNPVTGTGTSGQVTYFNGTSSVTSSSSFKFDGTNLTIGNPSSALAQLHIYNASAAASFLLQTNSTTDYSEIAVRNNSSTATSYFRQYSTATTLSDFGVSRAGLAMFFSNYATNFVVGTRNGGDLIFGTNDVERVRILSSNGYVGIGPSMSSPSYQLDVNGTGRFTGALTGTSATFSGRVGINGAPSTTFGLESYGEGRFYQPLTNTTAYLRIENNRTRNAAVYTATTNGGFYAGVSIGTDTFNYQIYDGVAGSARLTIASTGAATFSSSVNMGGKLTIESSTYDDFIKLTRTGIGSMGISATNPRGIQTTDAAGNFVGWHVTAAGNVGIGTTSPSAKLGMVVAASGTNQAVIDASNLSDASFTLSLRTNITELNAGGAGNMTFSNSSERMRITSGGKLCVNRTNTIFTSSGHTIQGDVSAGGEPVLEVYNQSLSDSSPAIACFKNSSTTSSSARFIQFYADAGSVAMGGIVGNGASNVQFASISDIREKENIISINGSLNKILALNPVEFDWKKTGEHIKAGFIAQQVEEVFPEYVVENMSNEGEEERKGLTGGMSSGIIAHLVKAIQEQQQQIEELKLKIK